MSALAELRSHLAEKRATPDPAQPAKVLNEHQGRPGRTDKRSSAGSAGSLPGLISQEEGHSRPGTTGNGSSVDQASAGFAGSLPALFLPEPVLLTITFASQGFRFTLGMSERCQRDGTFDRDEWLAMVAAAEADRAWPCEMRAWFMRKRSWPRWQLTKREAMGCAIYDHTPRGWTVERVLRRFGLTLVAMETLR